MSRNVWHGDADDEIDDTPHEAPHTISQVALTSSDVRLDDEDRDADANAENTSISRAGQEAAQADDYFGSFENGTGVDNIDAWAEGSEGDRASEPSTPQNAGPSTPVARRAVSSTAESLSIPDDTPSARGSLLSSPGIAASPLSRKHVLRTASGALQPFERRFESRLSSSPLGSPRVSSPIFLSPGSRQVSLSSRISPGSSQGVADADEPVQAPWEVVRWTRLRKLTGQVFSETGRRNFGRPTCLAVSALVAIGTTKGFVLGFDYHQTLKIIIGPGTRAAECGSVTALAISADYSTICSGHSNGWIFTWEVNRPARPFLQIAPVEKAALAHSQHPEGHVAGSTILHIGFLGVRHTAVVSADSSGMAFSHLASRGLGPVTRNVTTTRLLGRYPRVDQSLEQTRKPSSVLAFSPLPLGNVEQSTDQIGLTALLTPYLLVIVSTTPTAQTQHKAPRPKDVSPHSTLSGCLAWFPAVKLKGSGRESEKDMSNTKLVYCWSNVLSILEVHVTADDPKDAQRPPLLDFVTRSRWRAEEPIVAVQWLGRSVLAVLTISQRLLILEDNALQVTDSLDLLQRHIFHRDLFSHQLRPVVERLDAEDPSMHGVVADAFYMSFRAYKGRLFLLSFNDLAVGTLSSWADRLIALMEAGDHIAAIRLATDYYTGGVNNVTIGLPDNDTSRHEMVQERLLAMLTASLQYTFSQIDGSREGRLTELAEACFQACITSQELDFLSTTVFEFYADSDCDAIYIHAMEPYILEGDITRLPAEVIKSMVSYFISENAAARLEELLCRLDPLSFDLDEMTTICKQHNLYDALIFMWTQAIRDFITPLIDILQLVKLVRMETDLNRSLNPFYEPAIKVFPFLAFTLTGRVYPRGELMSEQDASLARADLYGFLFSGQPVAWPAGSRNIFHVVDDVQQEPAFPYLTLLLQFDAASFLSMLNEAFEDPSLNEADGSSQLNGHAANRRSSFKITRQHIISIMLDVIRHNDFDSEDIVYLDMFVARNLAKYPNQLVFSGSLLGDILKRLCHPPSPLLHEDCQLSAEYLLSAYQPPDITAVLEDLKHAEFYKVLKTIYRRQRLYLELLEAYFQDPEDKEAVFDQLPILLSPSEGLTAKQIAAVKHSIVQHANDLTEIDTPRTARTIAGLDLSLLEPIADALQDSYRCFIFLRTLFEPNMLREKSAAVSLQPLKQDERASFEEHYVQLMCKHEPSHVADYVSMLQSGDLRLAEVLPAMENSGVIDAEVMLLTRDGSFVDAMSRLTKHLQSLQQTLLSLLQGAYDSPDVEATSEAAEGLLEEIAKYTKVGIWLCQTASKTVQRKARRRIDLSVDVAEESLDVDEHLWLDLIDVLIQLAQKVSQALRHLDEHPSATAEFSIDIASLQDLMRPNVQQVFTSLLVATSESTDTKTADKGDRRSQMTTQLSFLRILRAVLQRAATSAPSLADLREVLRDIFSAYAFEQDVLTMANDLLGADVFVDVQKVHELRQRGWRPRTQVCEGCKRRAWGPGTGEVVWDEYVASELERSTKKVRKVLERGGTEQAKRLERGKGRMSALFTQGMPSPAVVRPDLERRKLSLVVFACRHVFHRICLDDGYRDGRPPGMDIYKCPLCTDKSSN